MMLVPAIEKRAREVRGNVSRGLKFGIPVLVGGVVAAVIYYKIRRKAVENEIAKLATDINVRNAILYVEAVKPPGLLMQLISKTPIGVAMGLVDKIAGFFNMSSTDQVLAITDRVMDWEATAKSYRILTIGRSLNNDIRKKLGGDYGKFVDRLANNTNAVDAERRRRENTSEAQAAVDKLRLIVLKYPEGVIKTVPSNSPWRNAKATAKRKGIQLYKEPAHSKAAQANNPGDYLGSLTGRFLNYKGRMAMCEMVTSKGLLWAEMNDIAPYSNSPGKK